MELEIIDESKYGEVRDMRCRSADFWDHLAEDISDYF